MPEYWEVMKVYLRPTRMRQVTSAPLGILGVYCVEKEKKMKLSMEKCPEVTPSSL
jgi:hypothetical protein